MLPSLPPALAEWLPFTAWGIVSVFQGVIWMELKTSDTRQVKRTDELRADNRVLAEKMDRLLEIVATVKQA